MSVLGPGAKCCGKPDDCDVLCELEKFEEAAVVVETHDSGTILFAGDLAAYALDDEDEGEKEEDDE